MIKFGCSAGGKTWRQRFVESKKEIDTHQKVLTSVITSLNGRPAEFKIASGISGSTYTDDDATLPLSEDVALMFGDKAECCLLHCIDRGRTKYCLIPMICN